MLGRLSTRTSTRATIRTGTRSCLTASRPTSPRLIRPMPPVNPLVIPKLPVLPLRRTRPRAPRTVLARTLARALARIRIPSLRLLPPPRASPRLRAFWPLAWLAWLVFWAWLLCSNLRANVLFENLMKSRAIVLYNLCASDFNLILT